MVVVYVLHSPRFNKIYVGCTANLQARLLSHNQLATKGWTINFRPWNLIHTEHFNTKQEAIKREKELKSARGRTFIRKELLKQ